MKKYMKPEIAFEDFIISTNIAAGCFKEHNSAYGICPIIGSGGAVFFNVGPDSACYDQGNGIETDKDGFCYHNPSESSNLFTSG